MSLDDRLRATMAAHGAALTSAGDPFDTVVAGARLRRRALIVRMAVTLAVIAGLAAAVPVVGAARSGPVEPAGVPWLDLPVPGVDPGVDGPNACGPNDLLITEARDRPAHYTLTVRNTSARACDIGTRPVVETIGPDGTVRVPTSEPGIGDNADRRPMAHLDPGDGTFAEIGIPTGCVPNGWPTRYDNVYAVVAGQTFRLDDWISSGCGLVASMFVGPARGWSDLVRYSPPSPVVAGVKAPENVRAGRILDFKVILRNTDPTAIDLEPLVYSMSLASDAHTYRLNTAGITIPARGTQWFDMRLRVPADLAPGSYALTWWLWGRPAAGIVAVDVQP